jgi:hypothetical protein
VTPGAESQGPDQAEELRIRSAADLEAALFSPDFGVRLHVLAAAASQPEAALRYGKHRGRDFIDLLIDQVHTLDESTLRQAVLRTLAMLPGRRVREALKKELYLTRDPSATETIAARLAREEPAQVREIFAPLLMQDDQPSKARAAALAMAGLDDLSPAERLRLALLGPGLEDRAPALDADSRPLWQEALDGPHRDFARRLLERQGEAAFCFLKSRWAETPTEDRAWLLAWGAARHQMDAVEIMAQALREGPDDLALKALELAPCFGGAAGLFAEAASTWADHPAPAIRAAALRAGADGVDPAELAGDQEPEIVRLAALERLGADGGPRAASVLASLLEDSSWRVRAAAAAGLARLGEPAKPLLKQSAENGSPPARVAAAGTLLELGEDQWLKDNLI